MSAALVLDAEVSGQVLLSHARARVRERLQRAAAFPILVVHAPAGFGKTTVVREFLAADDRPHRWLGIAGGQGDLLSFVRTFAECLVDDAPALGVSFARAYDRTHRDERAAAELATWAAGQLQSLALTLVIDGLENVTDERVFALLTALVDRTSSAPIHWILVTQSASCLPIASWLANDRMDLPIDDVDLALTYADLVAACERGLAPVARATLYAIANAAANWPASIALALGEFPAAASAWAEPIEVRSYASFAEHAYAACSELEQQFLTQTCVYADFDASVLEAAGWKNIEPLLTRLCDAALLAFTRATRTYSYHKDFRAFLVQRLQAGAAQRYLQVREACAVAYDRSGRWPEALRRYTDLQMAVPIARLLHSHGFDLLDRGEADTVSAALGVLNDAEFLTFPVALAVKASLASLRGSVDVAEAWFAHAIEIAADLEQRGTIVLRFATGLVQRDRREAIGLLEPIVAQGGRELGLTVQLAGLLATAYARDAQADRAARTIEHALEQLAGIPDPAVRAKLYFQAGYVAFFGGDAMRAKSYAQQAVRTASAAQLYDIAARALSILYNIALDFEGDVCAALRYLDALAAYSIKAGSRDLLVYATLAQFEIEVSRGDLGESARLDAVLQSLEIDYSLLATETLLPAQALRATWGGDFARAYRLIAATAEKQITPMRKAQRYAEIALYAAAAGLRTEAQAALSRALVLSSAAEQGDTPVAPTSAYIALTLSLLGRHRRAAQVLRTFAESTVPSPRFQQLHAAIGSINDRWENGRYSTDLRAGLAGLDACDFGGIGRLIEALPLPARAADVS